MDSHNRRSMRLDNPKLAYERGWLLKTIPEEPKCED